MSRIISRAESWDKVYESFSQINFAAFDYNTIKESLLDYMKLYFPENFNDYIESSEFIAVLELFSYIAELVAYRYDIDAHEACMSVAERKESILRAAKMLSYPASRNIPARGFVKLTSIRTSETIYDSQGRNLSGRTIIWNDPNNADWKEQFFLVINRILTQDFGTVTPNERIQVDDVLFELYEVNNNRLSSGSAQVFSYSASVSGKSYPMELVPVVFNESNPEERRPERALPFSLLYASDGLGDSSDTTGFLMFTKQGTLLKTLTSFDGITPNQTFDIEIANINNTDVWVNNINSSTGEIFQTDPSSTSFQHLSSDAVRFGEWVEVELANAENIIFNSTSNRHKYEIETLDDDQIRLVFGDGEFSDIPNGSFDVWYRVSANADVYIPQSAIVEVPMAFTYNDANGNSQSVNGTFSAISSFSNASASEDIEHIRSVASVVYYTQDRMVSGRDYNNFMLQDPTILKMKTINRTFAGDSKYIAWHDPSEYYENVKIFGDDLAVYWLEEEPTRGNLYVVDSPLTGEQLVTNVIEPLLSSMDMFLLIAPTVTPSVEDFGVEASSRYRKYFNTDEVPYAVIPPSGETNEWDAITSAIDNAVENVVDLYYSASYSEWTVGPHVCDDDITCVGGLSDSTWMMRIEARYEGAELIGWDVRWRTKQLVAQSQSTKFWQTNTSDNVITYDSLNSNQDNFVILKANSSADDQSILSQNLNYNVLEQMPVIQNTPNQGLPDIHRLSIINDDENDDGVPDNIDSQGLITAVWDGTWQDLIDQELVVSDVLTKVPDASGSHVLLPYNKTYIQGCEDYDIQFWVNIPDEDIYTLYTFGDGYLTIPEETQDPDYDATTRFILEGFGVGPSLFSQITSSTKVKILINESVYLNRCTSLDEWVPVEPTTENKLRYVFDGALTADERLTERAIGRYPLNFAWFHRTPRYNLIDPSASNINDAFIITKGYYTGLVQWITGQTTIEPDMPSTVELRTTYSELIENKMISDTMILHPGQFKILFGTLAESELRAKLKVIRPSNGGSITNNEVKSRIVNLVRTFFDIDLWEFGQTFYFSELAAAIHYSLGTEIDSIVIVPLYSQSQFGDLYQVQAREDELFIADIKTTDIEIVQSYTPDNLNQ